MVHLDCGGAGSARAIRSQKLGGDVERNSSATRLVEGRVEVVATSGTARLNRRMCSTDSLTKGREPYQTGCRRLLPLLAPLLDGRANVCILFHGRNLEKRKKVMVMENFQQNRARNIPPVPGLTAVPRTHSPSMLFVRSTFVAQVPIGSN